jgi:hypothetical protein
MPTSNTGLRPMETDKRLYGRTVNASVAKKSDPYSQVNARLDRYTFLCQLKINPT